MSELLVFGGASGFLALGCRGSVPGYRHQVGRKMAMFCDGWMMPVVAMNWRRWSTLSGLVSRTRLAAEGTGFIDER